MAPLATESITEAAAALIQAGYAVCRIDPKEKKPTYGSWQLKSLQPQDFAEDENIGIVFGLYGHAGVDLDFHPEDADAWDAADEILPYTEAIEGRPGVPTAHRIYRITDPENCADEELPGEASETRAAIDAGRYPRFPGIRHFSSTTGRQIDFLLAGGQAACPPSYHASSGTRRAWLNGEMGEPTPVTWAVLRDAVYRLCTHLGMDVARREKAAPVSAELLARVDGHAEAKRAVARLQRQTPKQHGMSQNYHGQQYAVACDLAEHGIPEELAWPIFREWNQNTATVDADPVLKDSLRRAYKAACFGCRAEVVRAQACKSACNPAPFFRVSDLIAQSHGYREPMIDGLLRRGETMNVIAAPKTGKSWLVMQLAFSITHGLKWMGRDCTKGTVLLVDNELHQETLAERLRGVSKSMRVDTGDMQAWCLRGHLQSLNELREEVVAKAQAIGASMIIFDALYRMIPQGVSENDNAGMMSMYNVLDSIAEATGASCVCVHHSSKGNQSEKSVTDGGAGAGSIARAADAHLFLREHEEEGLVSVDAVARSWPKPEPFCIAFDGIWHLEGGADPSRLKKVSRGQGKASVVPVAEIVARLPSSPVPYKEFVGDCSTACGCTRLAVETALTKAAGSGDARDWYGENRKRMIAAAGCAAADLKPVKDRVREYLREHPDAHAKDVAMACQCDPSTISKVKSEVNK